MMRGVADAIKQWVTYVHIEVYKVYNGAHYVRTVLEFAGAHASKEVEVVFDRAGAIGAGGSRLAQGAAVVADLLEREAIDISPACANQVHGNGVHLLEVV